MKIKNSVLLLVYVCMGLYGCMVDPSGESERVIDNDSVIDNTESEIAKDSIFIVKARFIDFTLGDASHYMFRDTAGNVWDFGGCDDKTYKFAIEQNQDKQNEENQGWTSNANLQDKWFNLKCTYRNQPKYPDGPKAKVPVIVEAKMVEE